MTKDMVASVRQRLRNVASSQGKRFADVLQHYALERWLYRLSVSPYRGRMILKGALMLVAWDVPTSRPTRDIDFLARADNDLEYIKSMVVTICQAQVPDDGLVFDSDSVTANRIAEDALYEGVRAIFRGRLGNARAPMQIDIGFSDIVTPGPDIVDYPTILEMPSPNLQAYNRETTIAEKFEAMVKLGEMNSRMKDFFDIWILSASQAFNGVALKQTIDKTFERRGTELSSRAVCFDRDFGRSEAKNLQWRAFVRRSALLGQAPEEFDKVWMRVTAFLQPLTHDSVRQMNWRPETGWTA